MSQHPKTILYLAEMYPLQPFSEAAAHEFSAALADCDPDQVLAAARHWYANDPGGFRPTPGKLKAMIANPDPSAGERAWQALLKAIWHYAGKPTHETVSMPAFADPQVAVAVERIGGFRQFLGGIDKKELDWTKAKFIKAYQGSQDAPLALPSRKHDALNGRGPVHPSIAEMAERF